ncbi:MAG: glycoside hydrolase family 3 C-terminal domain-containing protein [Anaerolineaceae bacterium]|nr:glycoside hydrolase family 3 C-terminal domain-containing protein [Anaerolineaceae bacterium]
MNLKSSAKYFDSGLPMEERVEDLLSRMTVEEKVSQMLHHAPAIPRLGIPGYDWWNECLHGIGRAGKATVFPQAIGMAASWNVDLIHRIADAISDEARAKFNEAGKVGTHKQYWGLTFWTPNINIFRDPRWGRGQETYGEDPYLTACMGTTFVKALQGGHPKYLKAVATPKHYAVHSGPEAERHSFDAAASPRDMRTTYLPAFKATVIDGKAESVMGAYNRTNGEACCASETLLQHILREEWGFDGYVVSDCGAIGDIYLHHKLVETGAEAAALAVTNGCDLNCGQVYAYLVEALEKGLISEALIDRSVRRLLLARFRLGMFDPIEEVPFSVISPSVVDCTAHRDLALEAARESMVLLKNEGILPLKRGEVKSIAVIGPKADDELVLRSNYYGTPVVASTIYRGIQDRAGEGVEVRYAPGCDLAEETTDLFDEAVELVRDSDIAVVVLGLSQLFEGEEGQDEGNPPGQRSFGDRTEIDLPGVQEALLREIDQTGKPVVLVLLNGSALAINWAQKNIPAILEAWYPGQAGGLAVGDVLFGDYNPSGRLPVTFYQSVDDLPPFREYSMANRTYRYFEGIPLYPFGYGLSYTQFAYSELSLNKPVLSDVVVAKDESLDFDFVVKNVGNMAGYEVAQVYVEDVEASVPVPNYTLVGFEKVFLKPGEEQRIRIHITPEQLVCYDDAGSEMIEPGKFRLHIGGHAPTPRGAVVALEAMLMGEFSVVEQLRQERLVLETDDYQSGEMPYLLYTPAEVHGEEKLPLVLFLHGAGERAAKNYSLLRKNGLPHLLETGKEFPFYVASPQCPEYENWGDHTKALNQLIDELLEWYPIDEDRIYITGLSMGGFGTWTMLTESAERFAAAIPICGGLMTMGGSLEQFKRMAKVPIWVFHSEGDPIVPVEMSKRIVERLTNLGGRVRATWYADDQHDSWTTTYHNPDVYRWLLRHRRK